MRRAPLRIVVPLAAALAAPLFAQGTNYTLPGSLGRPLVDRREALESAVQGARWRWGPVRVDPWLSLSELAWVEQRRDDGTTEGDLTATAGAGLDLFLPVAAKGTLAAEVRPEYVWWRDRTEQRRLAGRYALGGFLHANRLTLELVARSTDTTATATPELDRRVESLDQRLEAEVELAVFRRLSVFARGASASIELDDDRPVAELDALDRDESWWVGGVRLELGPDVSVGAGAGRSRARFDTAGAERDHRGSALYGELRWLRPKLQIAIEGYRTELEPASGSSFEGFDGTLASARARWAPRESFAVALYGLRALGWSVETETPFYEDRRWGTEVSLRPGWRTGLRAFLERGDHRYAPDAAGARRVDDVESVGAAVDLRLVRALSLGIEARRTEVRSDFAERDREFAEVRVTLTFGSATGSVF